MLELFDHMNSLGTRDAGSTRHAFKVAAGGSCGGKAADREQALIVKNYMDQIFGSITRERGVSAKVHQDGAIAIKDHNFLLRKTERKAQSGGRSKAHGMLQIEKVWLVPKRLQFARHSAHNRHNQAVFQPVIDRAQAVKTLHHAGSSHM